MHTHILLVEDNQFDAKVFRRALEGAELENPVTVAKDGVEALAVLRSYAGVSNPNLIVVTDLNMPRMSGLDLLRNIRSDKGLADLPVFVLTTSDAPSDHEQTMALGIEGYIRKTGEERDLVEPIAGFLERFKVTATLCLVIEDNAFDRKVLRNAAADCRLRLHLQEAPDLRTAETMLEAQNFDCIILDFRLPDGDGLSFAKQLLAKEGSNKPLIMLTGQGSESIAREAFQLGVYDYLTKDDLSADSLERAIANALTKVKLQRDRRLAEDELKRSNQALSRFAGAVAHDLKAPIRQINTFLVLLRDDYGEAIDEKGHDLLQRVERAAKRAYRLIDDMLAYASLGKSDERFEKCDLRSVADDAAADFASQIEECGASVEIGAMPAITGIRSQLIQLFGNLIGNALKFRSEQHMPIIKIGAKRLGSGQWEISVEDNGIGIASEHQEQIFGLLNRLHGADRYEGSGIGLATCKEIVANHGGRIWCRSEPDQGSIFSFTLREAAGKESRQLMQ